MCLGILISNMGLKDDSGTFQIRDTKGTFHAKMGSIKDRNGMDLKEAEDIKKRWPIIHRRTIQKRSSQPR